MGHRCPPLAILRRSQQVENGQADQEKDVTCQDKQGSIPDPGYIDPCFGISNKQIKHYLCPFNRSFLFTSVFLHFNSPKGVLVTA